MAPSLHHGNQQRRNPRTAAAALALQALLAALAPGAETLRRGLAFLLALQGDDGGFPCVESGDADTEIFYISHALLALAPFRITFFRGAMRQNLDILLRAGGGHHPGRGWRAGTAFPRRLYEDPGR